MTWDMNRSSDYKRLMENDDPIQKREAIAMPEEIKQLRDQLATCRALLQEAGIAWDSYWSDATCGFYAWTLSDWRKRAVKEITV